MKRLVKPRWWSFRTMAKPTRPRWLATKIFANLSLENDDPVMRERREQKQGGHQRRTILGDER
jgi:hypothetical protein